MSLIRFNKFQESFHPEFKSQILAINDTSSAIPSRLLIVQKRIFFIPVLNISFYELWFAIIYFFCPVWKYSKDKPNNLRFYLFVIVYYK